MVVGAKERNTAEDIGQVVLGLERAACFLLCRVIGENLYQLPIALYPSAVL